MKTPKEFATEAFLACGPNPRGSDGTIDTLTDFFAKAIAQERLRIADWLDARADGNNPAINGWEQRGLRDAARALREEKP